MFNFGSQLVTSSSASFSSHFCLRYAATAKVGGQRDEAGREKEREELKLWAGLKFKFES